jgi:transposase
MYSENLEFPGAEADSSLTKLFVATPFNASDAHVRSGTIRTGSKLTVPPRDLRLLTRLSRSARMPYRIVMRSRIILSLAAGCSERATALTLRMSRATVTRWRQRYEQDGIDGLRRDRPGRGRRPRLAPGVIAERAMALACDLQKRGERVSLRRIARELGISYASLQRLHKARSAQWSPGVRL